MAILFLELNGFRFGASEVDVVGETLALAAGENSEADYARGLEDLKPVTHVSPDLWRVAQDRRPVAYAPR